MFIPLKIGVLTISDTRTPRTDRSGGFLQEQVHESGHILSHKAIVPDEIVAIQGCIRPWLAEGTQVILTTGGTGFRPRDVTVQAVMPLLTCPIDGFGELFRRISYEQIGTSAIQSRCFAGWIGDGLVFCLPGSPGACRDAWDQILRLQLDARHKPCNFAEIIATKPSPD
ncbi:MAG: molybdopterin-binding protein [Pseudomonadota bacterium]